MSSIKNPLHSPGIKTIDELLATVAKYADKRIFVLFSGSLLTEGTNWCSDCVKAEPVIEKAMSKLPKNAVFLKVEVGDRTTWRDPNNPFRTHAKCLISSIPTLIEFNTMKRLSNTDILQLSLIELMFEED